MYVWYECRCTHLCTMYMWYECRCTHLCTMHVWYECRCTHLCTMYVIWVQVYSPVYYVCVIGVQVYSPVYYVCVIWVQVYSPVYYVYVWYECRCTHLCTMYMWYEWWVSPTLSVDLSNKYYFNKYIDIVLLPLKKWLCLQGIFRRRKHLGREVASVRYVPPSVVPTSSSHMAERSQKGHYTSHNTATRSQNTRSFNIT